MHHLKKLCVLFAFCLPITSCIAPRSAFKPAQKESAFVNNDYNVMVLGTRNFRHNNFFHQIAISKDGTTAWLGRFDGNSQFWDLSSGQLLKNIPKPEDNITQMKISLDFKKIVYGSNSKIIVWDVEKNIALKIIALHHDPRHLSITSDATTAVTTIPTNNRKNRRQNILLNLRTGEKIRDLKTTYGGKPFISPDGKSIFVCDTFNQLYQVNADTGKTIYSERAGDIEEMLFIPEDSGAIGMTHGNHLVLWDMNAKEKPIYIELEWGNLSKIIQSPDKTKALLINYKYEMVYIDLKNFKTLSTIKTGSYEVSSAAFSPDGSLIYSVGSENALRTWIANTGEEINKPVGSKGRVFALDFSPDGSKLLSSSRNLLCLWNTTTGNILSSQAIPTNTYYEALSLVDESQCNYIFFSESGHRKLGSINMMTGIGDSIEICSIGSYQLSGNQKRAVIITEDAFCIWDMEKKNEILKIKMDKYPGYNCVLNLEGDKALIIQRECFVLFDLESNMEQKRYPKEVVFTQRVEISMDGNKAYLIFPQSNSIQGVDLESGRELFPVLNMNEKISTAKWMPDNKTILVSCEDGALLFVNSTNGRIEKTMLNQMYPNDTNHVSPALEIAFSPDGKTFACGNLNGTITLYRKN